MNRIKQTIVSFLLAIPSIAMAQEFRYLKENNYYDLSLSSNGKQHASAISWNHLHGIGRAKKFSIGYGLRFTSAFGRQADFITAPAKLTSGTTGVGVIFSDNVFGNFDTITLANYNTNSINATIYLNYKINTKLEFEFNIDALGLTFGTSKTADYNSSKRIISPNTNTSQTANPTLFNILLVSDNDLGSLNSEILVKYWLTPKIALKLGGAFLFAEYTTNNKLYLDNDRFRNKTFLAMIGVSYAPFKI